MTTEKKLEFYERLYFSEIERRDKIDSSLGFHLGIITLLIGVVAAVTKIVQDPLSGFWAGLLSVCILGVAFCIAFAMYFVIRVRLGHDYSYIPDISDLEKDEKKWIDYNQKIKEYNEQVSQDNYQSEVNIDDEMISRFSRASKTNIFSNDNKSHYRHYATFAISIALGLCFIGIIPYTIVLNKDLSLHQDECTSKVEGTMEKSSMSEKSKAPLHQDKPKAKPSKTPPPPPKRPEPTPNRIIKEGDEKGKP